MVVEGTPEIVSTSFGAKTLIISSSVPPNNALHPTCSAAFRKRGKR